jgi:predicted GNAT family acetyltransferase
MTDRVVHNAELHRYEIYRDDELAGFTVYEPLNSQLAFVHTQIDGKFAGEGLGSTLVRNALDDVRERGIGVLPFCPFVHRFIERDPAYLDLVPAWARARFGLPAAESA